MDEFTIGWIVYGLAGAVTFAGCWYLTRRWPAFLRDLARVVVIVLLAVPAPVVGFPGHFAPAVVVAAFEGIFQPSGEPATALAALATGLLAGSALVLVLTLARRFRGRRTH